MLVTVWPPRTEKLAEVESGTVGMMAAFAWVEATSNVIALKTAATDARLTPRETFMLGSFSS